MNVNKSDIIGAVIIVAVFLGIGYYYLGSRSEGGGATKSISAASQIPVFSNEKAQGEESAVAYTDSGFSPKTITVKLGDTVAFRNESSGGMWVASAPHPVHTDYPAFDAKKAYGRGEAYTFTFDQKGNWRFHNHVKSTDFGSVTVE